MKTSLKTFAMPNTLITGHKGFIGTKLHKRSGFNAVGIDLKDGNDLLTCELPEDVDLIYHLAAQSSVPKSWEDAFLDSQNIAMTVRLSQVYPNARIIYAQSAAAQGTPASPYGFSKRAAGEYLKLFHKDYVNCVFPNVYGGSDKSVVDIFKGKNKVTVYGDGNQVRDYVHVDDIVEGLLKARDWPIGEFFMGSGIPTTVLELAGDREIEFAPARKEARESVLPNRTPNWEPLIRVHDYLNE